MDIIVTNYTLNEGQKEAAEAFLKFLFDREQKGFILSGPAGTGKTYLMGHIIDDVIPRYHEMCKALGMTADYTEVAMTAMTNKAAEVLSQSIRQPVGTIQSFLNLVVMNDYTTGRSTIKKTGRWVIHSHKIIFIDEASMMDTPLFATLLEGTYNCKLVFVGDRHQLSPVMEKISPIYAQGYPVHELLEPVRNAGQPALMALCSQLRTTVETSVFHPIQIVPGVIDHLDDTEMEQALYRYFGSQTMDSRIIAYTNHRVNQFNDAIRDLRNLPSYFQRGEILVNGAPAKSGNKTLAADITVTIHQITQPEEVEFKPGIKLWVQTANIRTNAGVYYSNVRVPCDKDHYGKLLKYFKSKRDFPSMYDLRDNFFDLRPNDASTIHKAQGSTFENIFVDLSNISTCNMADQVARMLYVAVSRPKSRLFLYGELASKYGGLTY
jgi:AAA domain/UvrD-like helicase C-terminal domain